MTRWSLPPSQEPSRRREPPHPPPDPRRASSAGGALPPSCCASPALESNPRAAPSSALPPQAVQAFLDLKTAATLRDGCLGFAANLALFAPDKPGLARRLRPRLLFALFGEALVFADRACLEAYLETDAGGTELNDVHRSFVCLDGYFVGGQLMRERGYLWGPPRAAGGGGGNGGDGGGSGSRGRRGAAADSDDEEEGDDGGGGDGLEWEEPATQLATVPKPKRGHPSMASPAFEQLMKLRADLKQAENQLAEAESGLGVVAAGQEVRVGGWERCCRAWSSRRTVITSTCVHACTGAVGNSLLTDGLLLVGVVAAPGGARGERRGRQQRCGRAGGCRGGCDCGEVGV